MRQRPASHTHSYNGRSVFTVHHYQPPRGCQPLSTPRLSPPNTAISIPNRELRPCFGHEAIRRTGRRRRKGANRTPANGSQLKNCDKTEHTTAEKPSRPPTSIRVSAAPSPSTRGHGGKSKQRSNLARLLGRVVKQGCLGRCGQELAMALLGRTVSVVSWRCLLSRRRFLSRFPLKIPGLVLNRANECDSSFLAGWRSNKRPCV